MSAGDSKEQFLYNLPPPLLWEFCRIMDGLSDLDWTRFAAEVLGDQTAVRLAERRERRTDWVMNQWGNRNGTVGELISLLERLQLLRPRDVILCCISSLKSTSSTPGPHSPHVSPQFEPASKSPPTLTTCTLSTTDRGEGRPLPKPAPPPSSLQSKPPQLFQPFPVTESSSSGVAGGVMFWSIEEVQSGTKGFSPSLQVGEGGFGVVYRATLRNTDCAVKRLKQDCLLDWTLLRESFQNEVDKLSKFRHPNIVELLGFSEGEGSVCLIYSYMQNRSVEDQLHNERGGLSWSQRLAIVDGASAALQFLHSPPGGHTPLIHGDVKSSNILLDQHLVPKLADFGLAQLVCRSSPGTQTVSVGKTATVRGTLAYLPDEYVRNGELSTALDVYSFGVVLLEVLTGRRALEKDSKSEERFLKDLVEDFEDTPTDSSAAAWRKQLDHRLITGAAADPRGFLEVVAVARRCLDKNRKKRPAMTEVFEILQHIHNMVRKTNSSHLPPHSHPRPASFLDSSVVGLSNQLSKLRPLEAACESSQSLFLSSFSCSLTPPDPLHSSSSLPTTSALSISSLGGPCETDESQGFSQYNLSCKFKSNRSIYRSHPSSIRDQFHCLAGPTQSQFIHLSLPTENQYSYDRPGEEVVLGDSTEPGTRRRTTGGAPDRLPPESYVQPVSAGPLAHMNLFGNQSNDKEGWIQGPKQLSDDLYGGKSSEESRGPEESDELDYLPA
ncbi:interleukin-1 receptor-associated kinase 1 isoform X2 [Betta splendens]|uniref:Interleukin-1 receptor-associated kinase 1 isoform X2 n=1 Tax=Betta splendens TaxID=158456 RepID=A0A6P7N1U0_BETSP|nr:interleukin-1 receptor-associated kinase 1 isoform X2 [Betta splendens]XP_055366097.1 interleukin-1 receptor-associated kinase 1 isoform X2 [Betta splendens]